MLLPSLELNPRQWMGEDEWGLFPISLLRGACSMVARHGNGGLP
jgi:hypothetical protein